MNIYKGLIFYLTVFFILSLVLSPNGRVANFVHSIIEFFIGGESYFTVKDWNLIILCIGIAIIIKFLFGGASEKTSKE